MNTDILKTSSWIGTQGKSDYKAKYLKKSFIADIKGKYKLYITAHGLYKVMLNGYLLDTLFMPGCDNYHKRLQYQIYDISDYVGVGNNEIQVILGNGWYKGSNGLKGTGNLYGDELGVLLSIVDSEGRIVLRSDESWLGSDNGPIIMNDLQQGEYYDARIEVKDWLPVEVQNFDFDNLVYYHNPIHEHESFKAEYIGNNTYDFSQCFNGYVEISVTAHEGDKIELLHGETLDKEGKFTQENFQPAKHYRKEGIAQEIVYICKEGANQHKPSFSVFGFRYIKVKTDIELQNIEFIGHAVYTDMKQTGFFECSDGRLNKLFSNTLWSQKSNFLDIPMDCPTRERAGWTGDICIYADTAVTLFDCYDLLDKWLNEVRINQRHDGRIMTINPPVEKDNFLSAFFSSSVGFGDACIIVPYTLYKHYKKTEILTKNYEMMKKWIGFLEKRSSCSRIETILKYPHDHKYIIDIGFDYGEWLEPGSSSMQVVRDVVFKGHPEIATAYFAYCTRLMTEIAKILGMNEDQDYYRQLHDKVKSAYQILNIPDKQSSLARALNFELLDNDAEQDAADKLLQLVKDYGYHPSTGFFSTAYLCEELAEYGYVEDAYKLLLQDTCPSWLYPVAKGSTTIWETWDGIREDGSVHHSLNHYAYGSVAGWLIRGICGINLQTNGLVIKPHVSKQLSYAKATYDSPVGKIVSGWEYTEEKLIFKLTVPIETTLCYEGKEIRLKPGDHTLQF